jgi:cobalt-zinc-cadmium resistance protein CzcA
VPLWTGQYKAGRKAAQSEAEAATNRLEAQSQAVQQAWLKEQTGAAIAQDNIRYYVQEALPRSQALIAAALRLREAGQIDYIAFLRTLDEAFSIQTDYVAQLSELHKARLKLLYLAGQ